MNVQIVTLLFSLLFKRGLKLVSDKTNTHSAYCIQNISAYETMHLNILQFEIPSFWLIMCVACVYICMCIPMLTIIFGLKMIWEWYSHWVNFLSLYCYQIICDRKNVCNFMVLKTFIERCKMCKIICIPLMDYLKCLWWFTVGNAIWITRFYRKKKHSSFFVQFNWCENISRNMCQMIHLNFIQMIHLIHSNN